jgi:electron transport complex protein RnfD
MNKLLVNPSPHIRSGNSTRSIMLTVIIALLPAAGMSVYVFGIRAAMLICVTVAACVVFEALWNLLLKREQTIGDLSAVVTGLLLAFNLPATLPAYMAVIGSFVAIVIVKMLFGGIGQNFVNPAIAARIVLMLSFTEQMNGSFVKPFWYTPEVDAVTTATPLAQAAAEKPDLWHMFIGAHAGCLGETSEAALLLGLIILLVTRVIGAYTPVAFVGVVALGSLLAGRDVAYELTSGGLILGAVFMATDYATTPLSRSGKVIFGLGCGIITLTIRMFGSLSEGVAFSILLMNILTPYIDMLTTAKPFGVIKKKRDLKRKAGESNAR